MNLTDYNFLHKLKIGKVNCSSIPKAVKESSYFENLVHAEVILLKGSWERGSVFLNQQQIDFFEKFLKSHFPHEMTVESDRANNIKSLRNSKGRRSKSNSIIFLRGSQKVNINGLDVDLSIQTKNFEVFASSLNTLKCDKVCFVENLHTFLQIESLISSDYVFFHAYGRIGVELLKKIQVNEALVFSDYDFVGLNEYLSIKEIIKNTSLFVPDNYDMLFNKYSRPLKDSGKKIGQKPSAKVLISREDPVVRIREQIFREQYFLEQEVVILTNI